MSNILSQGLSVKEELTKLLNIKIILLAFKNISSLFKTYDALLIRVISANIFMYALRTYVLTMQQWHITWLLSPFHAISGFSL